jgi:hypothetical protein
MNPSSNPGPELQLPTPVAYNPPAEQVVGQTLPLPEQTPNLAETAAMQAPAMPILAGQMAAPLAGPLPATPTPSDVSTTTNIVVPAAADDSDLIEKEWVTKAKQIIEKTRDDPYQQSQELTHFKSDYLQKRYNKSIKMSE